jgi:IPT/TIG domain
VPVLASVSPTSVATGNFSLTITGSDFVSGAHVSLAGTGLATTFVSSSQLTASGTASSAGNFAVAVINPNPGSAASGSVNLQVTSSSGGNPPPPPACSVMTPGQNASLNGFLPFPADNLWNTDISNAPVDPNSAAIINFIGPSIGLHADFGSGLYDGSIIGIPYLIVDASQGPVDINFTAYGDESDPGPMPIPTNAPIEGDPNPSGDQHVLVLDNSNCWLYELYDAQPSGSGWNAGSAAVWDLTADEQRPYTWTSADAAGLSIFAGLARYDEVAAGAINHALRFTLQSSRAAFTPPASHWASNSTNADAAPMGMRMRLKSSFDISGFSLANQVILTALQKYGMIMADNGTSMFITGAPNDNWNNDDLHNLGSVTAADFDVIEMNPVYTSANLPQGAAPTISSFTASSQSVSAGTPVTLNWSVTGASYLIVSPDIGATRGTSVVVTPTQSTTYTLYATNAFGRTTATVNITVQ